MTSETTSLHRWCVGNCKFCGQPVYETLTYAEMQGRTLPDQNVSHACCRRVTVTDICERLWIEPTTVGMVREAIETIDSLRKQQQADAETYLAIDKRNIELTERVSELEDALRRAIEHIGDDCRSLKCGTCQRLEETLGLGS